MRKAFSLFFCFNLFILFKVAAQQIPVRELPNEIFRSVKKDMNDTSDWRWKRGGIINFNLAQGSLSNWAAGGDRFSLSLNSHVNYLLLHKGNKHTWDNSFDFNYGYIQTTSQGGRKNDDRIDILSKYGSRIDTNNKIYLSVLGNFRSQFFNGYNYYSKDSSTLTSTFLSPAYILLSVGFDFKPSKNLSIFLSPLTNRTTYVGSRKLYMKGAYGLPPGTNYRNEIGAFASTNYFTDITSSIKYRGRLDLFSNYGHNPFNVDLYMTNLFSFKINKFLSATYNLDMIYDDDVKLFGKNGDSPGLQLKSLIGIGFMMPFAEASY
jgi:hypothetical protein